MLGPKKMPDLAIDMLKEMHGAFVTFCRILSSIRMKLIDFLLGPGFVCFLSKDEMSWLQKLDHSY